MNPNSWLKATVLAARELSFSDNRPLYAYRCSNKLFDRINTSLKPAFNNDHGRYMIADEWAAMYCLYAAEWWRRNHDGGTWSWNGIDESLCWKRFPHTERHKLIRLGLKWWKRSLMQRSNGDNLYLVTLACEGGLPLNLLRRTDSGLGRYFKALLLERQSNRGTDTDTRQLAERVNNFLPQSLHNEVVYELSARLIDAVSRCRQQLGQISRHPLEQLDSIDPAWRDNLPLLLNDGVAQQLIGDLLVERATPNSTDVRDFCTINRKLTRNGDGSWQIELQISLPSRVADETLRKRLPDDQSLPHNLDLRAQIGYSEHSIALLSRLATGKAEWRVSMASTRDEFSVVGEQALEELGLRLVSGATEYASWIPAQSAALAPDLPWFYVSPLGASGKDARQLELLGCGAITTREGSIFAALPPDWHTSINQNDDIAYHGENEQTHRKIYEFTQSFQLTSTTGDRCNIELGSNKNDLPAYQVHGKRIFWQYHRQPVYSGLPRLAYLDGEEQATVSYDEIVWRSTNSRNQRWIPVSRKKPLGDIRLRHVTEKGVRFDYRAVILPADAKIQVKTGRDNTGSITLDGFDAIDCSVENQLPTQVKYTNNKYKIDFFNTPASCNRANIKVDWHDTTATFSLPTPIESSAFIRSDGTQVNFKTPLSIDELMGVSAQIVSPSRDDYHMEVELHDPAMSRTISQTCNYRLPLEQHNGSHTLPLGPMAPKIRRLLALGSNSLDVAVRLTLSNNLHNRIRVQLFQARLQVESETLTVTLNGETHLDHEYITIDAISLWEPGTRVILPYNPETKSWSGAELNPGQAPWIAAAWRDRSLIGRPTWVPIPANRDALIEGSPDNTDLMSAVIQEPDYQQRQTTMRICVEAMSNDTSHPGWAYLQKNLVELADYPPASFEFVLNLTANPSALATGLFAIRGDAANQYWQLAEKMGFEWRLLPLNAWVNAATVYHGALLEALPEDLQHMAAEQTRSILNQIVDHIPEFVMLMHCIGEKIIDKPIAHTMARAFEAQLSMLISSQRDNLLRAKADNTAWPDEKPQPEWLSHDSEIQLPDLEVRQTLGHLKDYRQAVIDAPVAAGLQLASDQYPCRDYLSYLLAFREFDNDWFDSVLGDVLTWGFLNRDWEHDDE